MDQTITRRSALANGTLFLGAGLAVAAGTRPAPVAAAPQTTVINADELAAECRTLWAEFERSRTEASKLSNRLDAMLTPEQVKLAHDVSDARTGNSLDETDWHVAELARHFPGLAPALIMVWEHIRIASFGQPGACCTVAEGFEP